MREFGVPGQRVANKVWLGECSCRVWGPVTHGVLRGVGSWDRVRGQEGEPVIVILEWGESVELGHSLGGGGGAGERAGSGALGSDARTGMETETHQSPSSCGNAGRTHVMLGREGQDNWPRKAYGSGVVPENQSGAGGTGGAGGEAQLEGGWRVH